MGMRHREPTFVTLCTSSIVKLTERAHKTVCPGRGGGALSQRYIFSSLQALFNSCVFGHCLCDIIPYNC